MVSDLRTVFPCNTCSLTFATSALQRAHMQQSWHIYNLKRKVSGLSMITEREYEAQESKSEEVARRPRSSDDALVRKPRMRTHNTSPEKDAKLEISAENIPDEYSGKTSSTRCLFCPFHSSTHTANLEHMSTHHSLFVPEPSHLYSLASLLSYLAVIVFQYHECLYCGQEKSTVDAVQTHMRDKGHCKIDMSDLLDFWDLETDQDYDDDRADATVTEFSNTLKRLTSGLIISSQRSRDDRTLSKFIGPRHAHSRRRASQQRLSRRTAAIIQAEQQDQETLANPPSRQLALYSRSNDCHLTATPRTEQGLAGLTDLQIRTLQMVDKRMKSREDTAKAKVRNAAQQQPVKTIYYKTENPVYQAG